MESQASASSSSFAVLSPNRVQFQESHTLVNMKHSSAVRFLGYVTGAPPGAKCFRKRIVERSDVNITVDHTERRRQKEYLRRKGEELSWCKKGREPKELKHYHGVVPRTIHTESVGSNSSRGTSYQPQANASRVRFSNPLIQDTTPTQQQLDD